jgi:hypothetical protein
MGSSGNVLAAGDEERQKAQDRGTDKEANEDSPQPNA